MGVISFILQKLKKKPVPVEVPPVFNSHSILTVEYVSCSDNDKFILKKINWIIEDISNRIYPPKNYFFLEATL